MRALSIAIDYRLANMSYRGMARYCREITYDLIKTHPKDRWILFIDQSLDSEIKERIEKLNNWTVYKLPKSNFIVGEQFYIYKALKHLHIDVYWAPYNTFPLFKPKDVRYLVTVHDLIFMDTISVKGSLRQKIGALYRRWVLRYGLNIVDHFLTVSKYTQTQMEKRLLLPSDRISISYNCIGNFMDKVIAIRQSNIERGNYYFTLSGDAPNKNLPFILDYFKSHPEKHLLIGGVATHSTLRNKTFENIEFLPFGVDDNTIIRHYLACKAFLFLSLKEGFGIPVLEAMACNCRMLLSDKTSIPEIAGNCALYADPTDLGSLEQGIERLENFNPNLVKMQKRLKQFLNWSCSADIVYQAIRGCISK